MTMLSQLPSLPALRARFVTDWPGEARLLLGLTLAWLAFGLLMLFSASLPVGALQKGDGLYFFERQAALAVVGLVLLWLVARLRVQGLVRLALFAFVPLLAMVFLVKVPHLGVEINGARRWIQLGPLSLQPSELIKPCLVLIAAAVLPRWRQLRPRGRVMVCAAAGAAVGGILLQPDLGTAFLVGAVLWLMALVAGLRKGPLVLIAGSGIAVAALKALTTAYQRSRITAFLNPWESAQAEGYQLVQSLLAVGSGGTTGTGFGLSAQKAHFLPYPYSDFIFAVVCEELGLVGACGFLAFLLVFLVVGLRVAVRATDPVRRLLAAGSTLLLVGQAFLHIAVVTGAIPPKGIPLPLVSYGGSGLLASLVCCGLLIRAAIEMQVATSLPLPERAPARPRNLRRAREVAPDRRAVRSR